jgi:hypothetical protein
MQDEHRRRIKSQRPTPNDGGFEGSPASNCTSATVGGRPGGVE